ncbi:MAG: ACP S-malonyltransferase [Candidatus Sumerlaeota bacterium]
MAQYAFLFPGQGSQVVGMGKELYEESSVARKLYDHADAVLERPLSKMCVEGPAEDLQNTANTQPALYVTSCAAFETLREKGFEPTAVAGHSLGEYSALYAGGVFDFETGLKLVEVRGRAMGCAGEDAPGGMAAVIGLDIAKIDEICEAVSAEDGLVVVANDNSPGQTVISGEKEALEAACERLKEAGAKRAMTLPVSGAFHSPLMQEAQLQLASQLAESALHTPTCPFYPNVKAELANDVDTIRKCLVDQVIGRVRWVETMELMIKAGMGQALEVGPGKVLAGLMRRIDKSVKVLPAGSLEDIEALEQDA